MLLVLLPAVPGERVAGGPTSWSGLGSDPPLVISFQSDLSYSQSRLLIFRCQAAGGGGGGGGDI